jgi:Rab proteins geranylgeranyltransferase component A
MDQFSLIPRSETCRFEPFTKSFSSGIIYASVVSDDKPAKDRLKNAVSAFLVSMNANDTILWSLAFRVTGSSVSASPDNSISRDSSSRVMLFPRRPHDIAFDDNVLDTVRDAWTAILGDEVAAESSFLRFEERETELDD